MVAEKGLWRINLPGIPTIVPPKRHEVLSNRHSLSLAKCFLEVEIPMASFSIKRWRPQLWPVVAKAKYIQLPWPLGRLSPWPPAGLP